jgi:hypothetical protein
MGTLESAIDEIAAEDLGALPASVLATEIVDLDRAIARLAGEKARRVAMFDAMDGGAVDGAQSTAVWLRRRCHAGQYDSWQTVRVATALRELPATADALCAGEITWQQTVLLAPVLSDARAELGPAETAQLEGTLLAQARVDTLDGVRTAVRHVKGHLDPDGTLARGEREFDGRYLAASVTGDGLLHLQGRFDAEGGAVLMTALESAMPAPSPDDPRTRAQVRADAMVELLGGVLDSGGLPTVAGQRPHVTLTASIETLRREAAKAGVTLGPDSAPRITPGAELTWTGPIPDETARRLSCDSEVTRLLLDPAGQPLHLGFTRRVVSSQQRIALARRDGGCIYRGCTRPPPHTVAHHIVHWTDGGATDLDNLVLLCRYHHRLVHERAWRIIRDPSGRHTVEPPVAKPRH